MKQLHRLVAFITRYWASFIFTILVGAVVGVAWVIPPELFAMLECFLGWLEETIPRLKDNFAFLLGVGPFYRVVALSALAIGTLVGFFGIACEHGLKRRIAGALTMGTLMVIAMFTFIFTIYGAPIVGPMASAIFSQPILIGIFLGEALVFMMVGVALLAARCGGLFGTMAEMAQRVPGWLAAAGLWLTSLAIYSWTTLDPIRPMMYVLSAVIVALLPVIIPDLIEEVGREV